MQIQCSCRSMSVFKAGNVAALCKISARASVLHSSRQLLPLQGVISELHPIFANPSCPTWSQSPERQGLSQAKHSSSLLSEQCSDVSLCKCCLMHLGTLFLALSAALQQALDLAIIHLQDHIAVCCGLRDKHGPCESLGCAGLGTVDSVEGGDA